MYQNNYAELKKLVAQDGVVINISKHRNPDGSMNRKLNLDTWNEAVERFETISLWPKGQTPGFDDRDPLQIEPSIIFVPAQNRTERQERSSFPAAAVFRSGRDAKVSMSPFTLRIGVSILRS